jgi:hypothetical protein
MIIEVPFRCFRFVLAALLLTVLTHTQALVG